MQCGLGKIICLQGQILILVTGATIIIVEDSVDTIEVAGERDHQIDVFRSVVTIVYSLRRIIDGNKRDIHGSHICGLLRGETTTRFINHEIGK